MDHPTIAEKLSFENRNPLLQSKDNYTSFFPYPFSKRKKNGFTNPQINACWCCFLRIRKSHKNCSFCAQDFCESKIELFHGRLRFFLEFSVSLLKILTKRENRAIAREKLYKTFKTLLKTKLNVFPNFSVFFRWSCRKISKSREKSALRWTEERKTRGRQLSW